MLDSAFDFRTILRFVLPGAVCGLALVLGLDAYLWSIGEISLIRLLQELNVAAAIVIFVPLSTGLGVTLNALSFQRGYVILDRVFARKREATVEVERELYRTLLSLHALRDSSIFAATPDPEYEELLWRNRRAVFIADLDTVKLEMLDDQYSPYADFQLGFSISIVLLSVAFVPWLVLSNYPSLNDINELALAVASLVVGSIVVAILLCGSYSNYAKLREMRLVMIVTLAGEKLDGNR